MAETRNVIRWSSEGVEKVRSDYATVNGATKEAAANTNTLASAQREAASASAMFNSGLAAVGRSLLVYAAPAVISAAIKSATDFAGSLLDSAAAAGISTTRYQELRFALSQSGLSIEQTDMALSAFNSKLGDAARGNKQLTAAFKDLGVSAKDVASGQLSTQDALDKTITKLSEIDNTALRASLTSDIFGDKVGRKLSAALGQGTEEIERMSKAAHSFGLVMDESMVRKGEEAGDTMEALASVIQMKFNMAILGRVGLLVDFKNALTGITSAATGFESSSSGVASFFDTVTEAASNALNPVGAVLDRLLALQEWAERKNKDQTGKRIPVVDNWAINAPFRDQTGDPIKVQDNARSQAEIDRSAIAAREKAQRDAAAATADRLRLEGEEFAQMNKMTDAMMDGVDATNKATDARNAYQASLDDELRLLGMSDRARAIEIERLNAEREAVNLVGDARAKYIADAVAKRGAIYDQQQTVDAAKKAAEEVDAVWEQAKSGISDSWSDLWFDIFDKGKFKFGDFAKSLKSIWARTIADMIALSTQQSIVQPLFNAMFGGMQGGAGATGAAGTMDIFKLFGGGSKVAGAAGTSGAAGGALGAMGTIGSGIAGIGLALGVGKMGGSATGGLVGSTMLGAAGSVLGTLGILGAAAGPIGAVVGAILGGVMGGLMKPSPRSSSSVTTSGSGVLGIGDSYALGLDIKIGQDMANGVIRALKTFSDQLVTGLESDAFLGIVGQRGKKFFFQAQESDLKTAGKSKNGAVKFKEAEDAIAYAIEAAINSGVVKGLTDADKKLMRAAGSVEQAMQDVIASHDFKRELDFQFTGLSNPLSEAQARLEFEYQQQLILADKYEADKTKLEAVYAQKRLDLVKQYNDQQNAAMEQSLGGLKAYLFDLTGGSASPLSPTNRLNLAQTNYNNIRKRALAGDTDAIGQLQGASQDFLSASRSVFGSTAGFQANYQNVVATLSQITGSANPLAAANQNTAAAVNDNTRIQAAAAERAYNQRQTIINQNNTLISLMAPVASSLNRGSASVTQNGVTQVGTVDWASITQAVASIR